MASVVLLLVSCGTKCDNLWCLGRYDNTVKLFFSTTINMQWNPVDLVTRATNIWPYLWDGQIKGVL